MSDDRPSQERTAQEIIDRHMQQAFAEIRDAGIAVPVDVRLVIEPERKASDSVPSGIYLYCEAIYGYD